MQGINAWLQNGQEFSSGVELYKKYGSNSFFKKLLDSGPTPYNIQKLSAELESLAPAEPAIPDDAPNFEIASNPGGQKSSPGKIVPDVKVGHNAKDHATYLQLLQCRDDLVRQIDRNMAALEYSSDKDVLHQTAKQILSLHQKKEATWALIDYYDENGRFELATEVKSVSRETEMQLIYQSLSNARKRMADPGYKSKARTQKLIDKHQARLKELNGGAK